MIVSSQTDFFYNEIIILKDWLQAIEHVMKLFRTLASYGKIECATGTYVLDHSQLALQIGSVRNTAYDVPLRIIGLHHTHLTCEDHCACWNLGLDKAAETCKLPCLLFTTNSDGRRGNARKKQRAG